MIPFSRYLLFVARIDQFICNGGPRCTETVQSLHAELTQHTEALSAAQAQLAERDGELAAAHERTHELKAKTKVTFQALKEQKLSVETQMSELQKVCHDHI